MFSFVKRRAFVRLVGFLLIALFIWFATPYFAFADRAPLQGVLARLIAIALVVAVWAAAQLVRRFRASRASDRLASAVLSQVPAQPHQPSPEAQKLRERFEEAVATLRQQGRKGHGLYTLPWYVFIGAPGSGKTTALLNSGLRFPLEQRVGKGAVRGVGGTRNCDWWFTDEAVFLDTAGRYLTQDSDADADRAGWQEFLVLLRQHRKRRPLNGVILTVSTQDMLVQGGVTRETQVEAARRRLLELDRGLGIQLPVYVMVTKCDLIAGFTEYFDDLAQDGRAQVWGVTFPYEQTLRGTAPAAFPAEFDALVARLNDRLFARLDEERDSHRRARIFAFPQQMAALRDLVGEFVGEVFGSTRHDRPVLLRGVYFTSGTQDGTQIDRLLGAIGRRFGLAPEVVAAPAGKGKAYFVERLLKEVLIGESGLAGVNRRLEIRNAALQLAAYAVMVLVAVAGVIALSISYGRNRAYIGQVAADVAKLRAVPPPAPGATLEALLPRLDGVRAVLDSANRYRGNVPWAMRWGLYQGAAVGKSARDAYVRELDGLVLPRLATRLTKRVAQYNADPEKLYVYLKAYLMLGEPKHLNKGYLEFLADLEWNATGRPADASMARHFRALLEQAETLRPVPVDPALVAQARSTIRRASIPRLVYDRIKGSWAHDLTRGVRLDVAAGVGAGQVFARRSGASLSEPVPSLYAGPVFKDVVARGTAETVREFAADSWVWGSGGLTMDNPVKLTAAVLDLYERDYIAAWDRILDDVQLVPFSTVAQMSDALGILAGPTSPMRGLLAAVVDHTSLVEAPAGEQSSGAASSAGKAIRDRLGKILKPVEQLTGTSAMWPGAMVTAHFEPVHRLVSGEPGATPLDALLSKIGQVQAELAALGPAVGGTPPLAALSNPALREVLAALQQDAGTYPPPVRSWVLQIAGRAADNVTEVATRDLESRYDREVLQPCNEIVAGRYPFVRSSSSDVPLRDFGRLLGHGGVFDTFFQNNLEPLVDTSRRPWTWRPDSVRSSPAMLAQFEGARRVRDLFFPAGSQAPSLRFMVTLWGLDASSTRFVFEIDGQRFEDRRGPTRTLPAVWPARSPGETVATFEDTYGAWPTQRFVGPWALFRMLDATQTGTEGDLRVVLGFENGARQARITLEAPSLQNPFTDREWQHFRCGT